LVHYGGLHRVQDPDWQNTEVLKAVSFEPGAQQDGLKPIRIAGDPDYEVDPATDDFYRRLIDLRSSIKTKMKSAVSDEREELDALRLCLSGRFFPEDPVWLASEHVQEAHDDPIRGLVCREGLTMRLNSPCSSALRIA
jgi:hypothetical protein